MTIFTQNDDIIEYSGEKIHIDETNSFSIDIEGDTHVFEFCSRRDKEDAVELIRTYYESEHDECYLDNVTDYYTE